jgi:hypothetical protein
MDNVHPLCTSMDTNNLLMDYYAGTDLDVIKKLFLLTSCCEVDRTCR